MMRIPALLVLAVAACGGGPSSSPRELPASDRAQCVALGADYRNNAGTLAVVGLPSLTVLKDVVPGAVSGDPVLRAYGGKLYVINRSASNVTVIDAHAFTVDKQFSTGPGSNPQDIALDGDKAYVPLYDRGGLQVWDLSAAAPAAPARTIDLSSYDEDGVPQANSVAVAGGRAFVTLDLLDQQNPPSPRGNGKVVVIDTASDEVAGAFDLRYSNPYDFIVAHGDRLLVSTFADFSGVDGCLEQIAVDGEPRTLDCLVKNSDVNGVIDVIAPSDTETYVTVSRFDADFNQQAEIRRLRADGQVDGAPLTPSGEVPTDLALSPNGYLVYADAQAGGLRVYDLAAGAELTTGALDIGLTPATANAIVCLPR